MKKLMLGALLLAVGTACPKVERKVYTFDLKAKTGTLVFENIVTDTPATPNKDFMDLVNEVIRGTKIEEQHVGWRVGKKELFENEGRLDGRMAFTFDSAEKAGIYKRDKKAPYIWCTNREEEETIIATNGERLDDVLPGCVAWSGKTTKLEVTVRAATMTGGEVPLVAPWKKWSAGEELEIEDDAGAMMGGSMEDFGEILAQGMAGGATLTVGPVEVKNADPSAGAAIGSLQESVMKLCLAETAAKGTSLTEVVQVKVKADGTHTVAVVDSSTPDPTRTQCLVESLKELNFAKAEKAWSLRIPLAISAP